MLTWRRFYYNPIVLSSQTGFKLKCSIYIFIQISRRNHFSTGFIGLLLIGVWNIIYIYRTYVRIIYTVKHTETLACKCITNITGTARQNHERTFTTHLIVINTYVSELIRLAETYMNLWYLLLTEIVIWKELHSTIIVT